MINRCEFEPFELDMMPDQPSTSYNFSWDDHHSRAVGVMGKASVPIASGIPGLDVEASTGALFSRRVASHHHFARLNLYVHECLKRQEVSDHIKRISSVVGVWTIYMITGLAVARGCGASAVAKQSGVTWHGGISARALLVLPLFPLTQALNAPCSSLIPRKIPALAEIGPELSFETSNSSATTSASSTDLILAIKLAKITKHGLQKNWSVESVIGRDGLLGKRAIFSATPREPPFDPKSVLVDEALDDAEFDSVAIQGSGDEEYYIITLPTKTDEEEKKHTQQAAGSS